MKDALKIVWALFVIACNLIVAWFFLVGIGAMTGGQYDKAVAHFLFVLIFVGISVRYNAKS